jgi:UDP-N-acetylglucosamine 2-epimerase (hydrolysing)
MKRNIEMIREALEASHLNFVVIYPNNDNGSNIIMEAYERLANNGYFRLIPSMRFEYFLSLLKHARAIVGKSSAGVREAPVYGVPTLNIGSRQKNRFNHPSIINLGEDREEIIEALKNIPQNGLPSMHFGNGKSAEIFIRELRNPQLWSTPCQKQFRDLDLILPA